MSPPGLDRRGAICEARDVIREGKVRETAVRLTMDADNPRAMARAVEDIQEGFRRVRLIWHLARVDIVERYRGSVLGPFWLTVSTAIFVAALGFVYSRLFGLDAQTYLPWLATSIVIWNFINTTVLEGCAAFVSQEALIRQMRLPFSVHVGRVVVRNIIVLAHHLPIVVVVGLLFGLPVGISLLLVIPGMLIVVVAALAFIFSSAVVCARFRDVPQVIASIFQILFFVTPVMWMPELLGGDAIWLWLNPLYALMELVRAPLLGYPPALLAWGVSLLTVVFLAGVGFAMFARYRARIAFWM